MKDEDCPLTFDKDTHERACAAFEAAFTTLEDGILQARKLLNQSCETLWIDGNSLDAFFLLARAGEEIMDSGKIAFLDVTDALQAVIQTPTFHL